MATYDYGKKYSNPYFCLAKASEKAHFVNYFSEPFASELTTAFVRNANPTLASERMGRFGLYGPSAKQKGHSFECPFRFVGDPYGNRTHVTAVKGPCLSRLTNGPSLVADVGFEPTTCRV